jgi:hypothetical protein
MAQADRIAYQRDAEGSDPFWADAEAWTDQ